MIDVNLLKPGDVDFNKLPESFIIMFMPFDLFGKDCCMYTFTQTCTQDPSIQLEDGTTRISLNTHGTNRQGVSDELFELLRYMEFTTNDVALESINTKIQELNRHIEAIRADEEVGQRYMQLWEEKIIERNRARQEGHAEGLAEGLVTRDINLIKKKLAKEKSIEMIADDLETDAATVKKIIADYFRIGVVEKHSSKNPPVLPHTDGSLKRVYCYYE